MMKNLVAFLGGEKNTFSTSFYGYLLPGEGWSTPLTWCRCPLFSVV